MRMPVGLILDEGQITFNIPLTSGNYAPENLTMRARGQTAILTGRITIEAPLPAGASIELWILKTNGDPDNVAHYTLFLASIISGATLQASNNPYSRALQWRAKSGGAAGAVIGHGVAI